MCKVQNDTKWKSESHTQIHELVRYFEVYTYICNITLVCNGRRWWTLLSLSLSLIRIFINKYYYKITGLVVCVWSRLIQYLFYFFLVLWCAWLIEKLWPFFWSGRDVIICGDEHRIYCMSFFRRLHICKKNIYFIHK